MGADSCQRLQTIPLGERLPRVGCDNRSHLVVVDGFLPAQVSFHQLPFSRSRRLPDWRAHLGLVGLARNGEKIPRRQGAGRLLSRRVGGRACQKKALRGCREMVRLGHDD